MTTSREHRAPHGFLFILVVILLTVVLLSVGPDRVGWVLGWTLGAFVVLFIVVFGVLYSIARYRHRHALAIRRLMAAGDVEGAELEARRRLERSPDSAMLHNEHGVVLLELKRYDDAAAAFERAAEDARVAPIARANRGLALCRAGRYAEGEPLLLEAAENPQTDVLASFNLAAVLSEAHRTDEARPWFDRAEELLAERDDATRRMYAPLRDRARRAMNGEPLE